MNFNSTKLEIIQTIKGLERDKMSSSASVAPAAASLASVSIMSTLFLLYYMQSGGGVKHSGRQSQSQSQQKSYTNGPRSTPLPGFGIFGDRVNEFVEIFLDAQAIYVHK
jgi:hypothetical protein